MTATPAPPYPSQLQPGLFETVEALPVMAGVSLLRGLVSPQHFKSLIDAVLAVSPLRHMQTPRGHSMSVAMSNCGAYGWVSDRRGYRYSTVDPMTENPWPPMPPEFLTLAEHAAGRCGFAGFNPDACLINCYAPQARMGAHQDRDEQDLQQPIVSVSLGLPARFFVIGPERKGKSTPVDLISGDVVVFGGPARLFYHGVRPLKHGHDPVYGERRINLTFRVTGLG